MPSPRCWVQIPSGCVCNTPSMLSMPDIFIVLELGSFLVMWSHGVLRDASFCGVFLFSLSALSQLCFPKIWTTTRTLESENHMSYCSWCKPLCYTCDLMLCQWSSWYLSYYPLVSLSTGIIACSGAQPSLLLYRWKITLLVEKRLF